MSLLDKVRAELSRYEHALMLLEARETPGGGVELVIAPRRETEAAHVYRAAIHPRDIESARFAWSFQRFLYDCLHDYCVELFLRTPQSRDGVR